MRVLMVWVSSALEEIVAEEEGCVTDWGDSSNEEEVASFGWARTAG